jgi:hypothetical protein
VQEINKEIQIIIRKLSDLVLIKFT